jgi:hypothetical protein
MKGLDELLDHTATIPEQLPEWPDEGIHGVQLLAGDGRG